MVNVYLIKTLAMFRLLIAGLIFHASSAIAGPITLDTAPGQFQAQTLDSPGSTVSVSGTMRIVNYAGTEAWPTASYIGVHQGPDRNQSVQVVAIRNRASDDHLVVGYRLIVDGLEAKVESIKNVSIGASVRVDMKFSNGTTTIRMDKGATIQIETPFSLVSPYVSVSSGQAVFSVDY